MVPAMAVTAARIALFFYVRDLTAGGHFAVSAHHASAAQGSEAKKSNETHHILRPKPEAIRMPLSCDMSDAGVYYTYRHMRRLEQEEINPRVACFLECRSSELWRARLRETVAGRLR